MKIYKQVIPHDAWDEWQTIKGMNIVYVGIQNDVGVIWYEVSDEYPDEEIKYKVVGTGWEYPDEAYVVGTILDGPFVWHVIKMI